MISAEYHTQYRENNRKYIRISDVIRREQGRSVKLKEIRSNFKKYHKLYKELLEKRELRHKEEKEQAEQRRKIRHYCQKFDEKKTKWKGTEERLLKKRLYYQKNKEAMRLQKTIEYHLGILPLLTDVRDNKEHYEEIVNKLKNEV